MGTDIHSVFQARVNGEWQDVGSNYNEDRHYALFAHLAGVRNGYGFAGCVTGQAVTPISEPRGIPDDFTMDDGEHHSVWLGDHSYSWLTADEIINHSWPYVWKCGIIGISAMNEWDGVSPPESYCGGISGLNVVLAETPVDIEEGTTHVRVFWRSGAEEFAYFVDEVKRLRDQSGEVRMVFGFDS